MLNQFELNESKSVLLGTIHFVNRRFEVLVLNVIQNYHVTLEAVSVLNYYKLRYSK